MNFDEALKHYLPRVWFRFKFIRYKFLDRGESEFSGCLRHLVGFGTTAITMTSSVGPRHVSTERETLLTRLRANLLRARRKFIAAMSFFRAWGVRELLSFLPLWR